MQNQCLSHQKLTFKNFLFLGLSATHSYYCPMCQPDGLFVCGTLIYSLCTPAHNDQGSGVYQRFFPSLRYPFHASPIWKIKRAKYRMILVDSSFYQHLPFSNVFPK